MKKKLFFTAMAACIAFSAIAGVNPTVQFDLSSSSVSEGAGTMVISVSIQNANLNPTSVGVNLVAGATATSGVDYNYAPLTITFPGGSTAVQNILVVLNDDAFAEGNESFTLELAIPTNNATVGAIAQHTVTIIDNDVATSSVGFGYPITYRAENAGTFIIPVTLNGTNSTGINTTMRLVPPGTTATRGSDFLFNDTTLTWATGMTGTIDVPVTILNDSIHEPDEYVRFQLINTSPGAIATADTCYLVIMFDDPLPTGDCRDLYFSEFISGSGNNQAIEIYNPTSSVVDLHDYGIIKSAMGTNRTAFKLSGFLSPGQVYVVANALANSVVTGQADTLSGFFNFTAHDALYLTHVADTIDAVGLSYADPGNYGWPADTGSTYHHTLVRNSYVYHGQNHWDSTGWNAFGLDMFDSLGGRFQAACGTPMPGPPTIGFDYSITYRTENAGQIALPVTLTNAGLTDISTIVRLILNGTTATPESDFTFRDTLITWPAGTTGSIYVPLTIINDLLHESDEYVRLQLFNTTLGTRISRDTLRLVIMFDEPLPSGDCSDLYFSEYIHGSGNNHAIEIYNPTPNAIDMHDYSIVKGQNGNTRTVFWLSDTISPNSTYVLSNPLANSIILNMADTTSFFFNLDGAQSVYLIHIADTIDAIGQSYIYPGAGGWPVATGSTVRHTLIKSAYHYHGNSTWDSAMLWWKAYPVNMLDSLGAHHQATCGAYVPFPSLAEINFIGTVDSVTEGTYDLKIAVRTINYSGYPLHFAVAHDDAKGTATQGQLFDYYYANTVLYIDTGVSIDTVTVQLHDDEIVERTENIFLRFLNIPINGTVGPDSTFQIFIKDSDALTTSFYGAGFSYIEKDTVVNVRVVLSAYCADSTYCADSVAVVHVSLGLGSATPGADFIFNDTTLTFRTNSVDTHFVNVQIFDDNLFELNEEINLNITNDNPNISYNVSAYTVRIIDNDNPVGFSEQVFDTYLSLYPNPANGKIYVDAVADAGFMHIINLLAEEVSGRLPVVAGKNTVDISALPAGMYFLCVNNNGLLMSKRFIIK